MNAPIFVLGTQRSGTTLLCRMLSAHPDIFIQNELNVRQMFAPSWTRDQTLDAIKSLIHDDHAESLESILERSKKKVWGLKDPELTYHLEELKLFIPESKFIVIIRDGRAVTNSYMENKWGLGTNVYTGAKRWSEEVGLQKDFKDRYSDNVHLLRYEDLVIQPEHELSRLFEFLSMPFHQDVLNYNNKPSFYHKTRENLNTYRKLDADLTKKWKKKLTSRQIEIIDNQAGTMLTEFGYPVSESSCQISAIEKVYYLLHQKIVGELQIQYRWRLSMIREYLRKRALNK